MAVPQRHVFVQDDIHLDVELVPRVVRLDALDLLDGLGEAHGQVQQDVTIHGVGGGTGEVFDMGGRGQGPVEDDVAGK